MNRRDVLPGHVHSIELDPADHEEPTWEVRQPGRRRRFDRRARTILTVAAVAALLANAGAAWAYWHFNGPGEAAAGTAVEITLTATSDPGRTPAPGDVGNLTVTVTNQHATPVHITAILAGDGRVEADEAHRRKGCTAPPVALTAAELPVSWEVPRNTIGAFILPGALTMKAGGQAACEGATFTVPVRARAVKP